MLTPVVRWDTEEWEEQSVQRPEIEMDLMKSRGRILTENSEVDSTTRGSYEGAV